MNAIAGVPVYGEVRCLFSTKMNCVLFAFKYDFFVFTKVVSKKYSKTKRLWENHCKSFCHIEPKDQNLKEENKYKESHQGFRLCDSDNRRDDVVACIKHLIAISDIDFFWGKTEVTNRSVWLLRPIISRCSCGIYLYIYMQCVCIGRRICVCPYCILCGSGVLRANDRCRYGHASMWWRQSAWTMRLMWWCEVNTCRLSWSHTHTVCFGIPYVSILILHIDVVGVTFDQDKQHLQNGQHTHKS